MQAYQQKTEKFFVSKEKKFGRIDSWSTNNQNLEYQDHKLHGPLYYDTILMLLCFAFATNCLTGTEIKIFTSNFFLSYTFSKLEITFFLVNLFSLLFNLFYHSIFLLMHA